MKKFTSLFFALTLFLVVATSCKKDEPEPVPPTKTELLTKSSWTGTTGFEYTNGVQTDSWSNADIKFIFKTNGVLEHYLNNVLDGTGTWVFIDNETKLQIFDGTETGLYLVETLNDSNLSISITYTDGGTTYKEVANFVH